MYANNDVIGIGNAIVDILSTVSEAFLKEYNLDKGNMTLISAETAEKLFQTMQEPIFVEFADGDLCIIFSTYHTSANLTHAHAFPGQFLLIDLLI